MRANDSDDDDDNDDEIYTINNNSYNNKPLGTTRRKLNLKTETKTLDEDMRTNYVYVYYK